MNLHSPNFKKLNINSPSNVSQTTQKSPSNSQNKNISFDKIYKSKLKKIANDKKENMLNTNFIKKIKINKRRKVSKIKKKKIC